MATTKRKAVKDRFVKLSATGRELSRKATKWTLVLDRGTKLIWPKDVLSCGRVDWEAAKKAAASCRIDKHTNWRLPTIKELLTLVDYSRASPAIDTTFFTCEPAFHWSVTPLASSPGGCAWVVDFSYGGAYYSGQDNAALVRPVRSARASQ